MIKLVFKGSFIVLIYISLNNNNNDNNDDDNDDDMNKANHLYANMYTLPEIIRTESEQTFTSWLLSAAAASVRLSLPTPQWEASPPPP